MTASPKRRWLSFSLRTMFVAVALVASTLGWLVWQIRIVQERKTLLQWAELHGGTANTYDRGNIDSVFASLACEQSRNPEAMSVSTFGRRNKSLDIPWFRKRCLGDQAFDVISLPKCWNEQPEAKRIDAAFLEAYVFYAP